MTQHIAALKTLMKKDRNYLYSKIAYLEAQANTQLDKRAKTQLIKASEKHMLGSAIVITLTAIDGTEIICPLAIKDGLSEQLLNALFAEIDKSNNLHQIYNK